MSPLCLVGNTASLAADARADIPRWSFGMGRPDARLPPQGGSVLTEASCVNGLGRLGRVSSDITLIIVEFLTCGRLMDASYLEAARPMLLRHCTAGEGERSETVERDKYLKSDRAEARLGLPIGKVPDEGQLAITPDEALETAYCLEGLDWRHGLTRDEIRVRYSALPLGLYLRLPDSKRFTSVEETLHEAGVAPSRAEGDFLGRTPICQTRRRMVGRRRGATSRGSTRRTRRLRAGARWMMSDQREVRRRRGASREQSGAEISPRRSQRSQREGEQKG